MVEIVAVIISLFFAMNIGASGAAASMGIAYGSGAIRKRRIALWICALGVIMGAVIGGGEVVKTISSGIMPSSMMSMEVVIIILSSATLSLFLANLMGIPLSTSEVTVGAVVGIGIAYEVLYVNSLLFIMAFWVIVPVIGFLVTYISGKLIFSRPSIKKAPKFLTIILIAAGFLEAFSAGMNNVANAVGPLVGAGVMSTTTGTLIGGLAVGIGAIVLGGKVLETNGKKITQFTKGEGILLSSTGAGLVIISSIFGLPVPLTQVTTSSIIGIGMAKKGRGVFHKQIVQKMLKVWIVSPLFSLTISYFLVQLWLLQHYYSLVVLISVMIATTGAISLKKMVMDEKRAIQEQGGGI
ncbi:inorganic phosphate transporter [Metabacillus arenae]|uniref:Inorganic phosphate transporter n=1 Tax=Metabacillus arenae TaxID=2771434 RepID=A0A926S0F8_9BACI|nr:inorganic phosphate transporter [Metabacillus arenae]MBD1379969.1 inorganic phosphate transporter [Metabacillus arenae]